MAHKSITHVATTDIADMMNPGAGRRMELPGFAPEFVDLPHYIVRITERIWHDREVDLILDWYAEDCTIHTLAGDIFGARTVVDNTHATLKAFPDRRLDADNVIWSDEGGAFYSSHLITSKMTNLGDSDFGPATGRRVRVQTIADCLCRENRVVEEWLVRDNLGLTLQLGFDPDAIARRQAADDRGRGTSLIAAHADNRARTTMLPGVLVEPHSAAALACEALRAAWGDGDAGRLYDFRVGGHYPGGADLYGPDQLDAYMTPVRGALGERRLRIEHVAEIPYLGDARDVALRWSVAAVHSGAGRYGSPTGAPIYVLGVSHFRIMNGRVREEIAVWDDIAIRRQIETARL